MEYQVVTRGQTVIQETQPGFLSNASSVSPADIGLHQKSDAPSICVLMPAPRHVLVHHYVHQVWLAY